MIKTWLWVKVCWLTFQELWWWKRQTALQKGLRWRIRTPWWTRGWWLSLLQWALRIAQSMSRCKKLWCTAIQKVNWLHSLYIYKTLKVYVEPTFKVKNKCSSTRISENQTQSIQVTHWSICQYKANFTLQIGLVKKQVLYSSNTNMHTQLVF